MGVIRRAMMAVGLAAAVAASPALAQGVTPPTVNTAKISRSSPAHYFSIAFPQGLTANATVFGSFVYPFAGGARLVDVILYQASAGTVGTSWNANVRNAAGTSMLTTQSTLTLAAGAGVAVDAKAELSLPGGCTRPVIKTDTTPVVQKGDYVDVNISEAGSYTVHPSVRIVLVFEPLQ